MKHTFKTLLFTAVIIFGSTASEAAEKSSAPKEVDVDTICFAAAEVCLDACGKAALTAPEFAICNNGCGNSMRACLGQTASQGGTATSKDKIRPKRQTKKYVPSN